MNTNEIQKLVNIYNALLSIHTCGEESFIMVDCLHSLRNIIQEQSNKPQTEENKEG